ncbi:MAG: UDP-3-O-(3-hydroxymyristoyl)glucosamine N-acyltransferase [Chitinivibrionales bacterium]|nr:UDP-3-O-(3-hydroxymyristoyl)glucosamine N-acyltransferase [Chitinivibrionales bacterium]
MCGVLLLKLSDIAQVLQCPSPTDGEDIEITAISAPQAADRNAITFLSNTKYKESIARCNAAAVICPPDTNFPDKLCLNVSDPYVAYAKIAQAFEDTSYIKAGAVDAAALVHADTHIATDACIRAGVVIERGVSVGAGSYLGAGCIIEENAAIGENCRLHAGVIVRRNCVIGNNVILEPGVVIGSDGFGNAREHGKFIRIPSFGRVVVHDDVWIGANSTIDRGAFDDTVIARGVRIDNLVQIAHNVVVGEDCALAAQAGVSGSTTFGRRVIVGGQAGFVGHIEIGDDAFVGAKAGVSKNVQAKAKITGCPARNFMTMRRIEASQSELPDLRKKVKKLETELAVLRNRLEAGRKRL